MKEEKKIIENQEVTKVASYGDKKDYLVIDLVLTYENYMNYKNFRDNITRFGAEGQMEIVPMNLKFTETKEYKLLKSQLVKIGLDGKDNIEITEENILKILTIHPTIFEKIMNDIKKSGLDKGLIMN